MKKLIVMLVCAVMACGVAMAKGPKEPEVTEVSLVGEGVGNDGKPLMVVTCAAKKADKVTDDEIRRCAVHGIIFRGYSDKSNSKFFDASTSHPALLPADQEAGNADYFTDFFGSGAYNTYVDIIPDTRRVMKNGKQYYVSQTVVINVPALRKKLENDGMLKSLKSGW